MVNILEKYIDEQEVYIVKYKNFIQYGLRQKFTLFIVSGFNNIDRLFIYIFAL